MTYAVAWVAGYPASIPAFRVIQLAFVAVAAVLATIACCLVYGLAYPDRRLPFPKTWVALWSGVLVLAATSPEVNKFVHCLHPDALALLVSVGIFLALVCYLRSPTWAGLLLLAVGPAAGFLTNQFLVSWGAVIALVLLLDRPRDWKRLVVFLAAAAAFVAAAVGACYLIWGEPFMFWAFQAWVGPRKQIAFGPGSFGFSVARMADHTLQAWFPLAVGVVGGWLLLRGERVRRLGPLWAGWAALVASEAFFSGAGWGELYHFGPGVVLGAVWLLAALPDIWHGSTPGGPGRAARGVGGVAVVMTVLLALQAVPGASAAPRSPQRRPTPDLDRYVAAVEQEFDGLPPDRVLLDVGNWVYLPHGVLQRDRAVSLGEPAMGMYENLHVLRDRLRARAYDKVLVRDFHTPWFMYDYGLWPQSSGVRAALLEHYTEVRTIPAAAGQLKLEGGRQGPPASSTPAPCPSSSPGERSPHAHHPAAHARAQLIELVITQT